MPYSSYSSIDKVARPYQLTAAKKDFVELLRMPVSDYLKSELEFSLRRVPFAGSEFAACENLIFPILKEVWRFRYLAILELWSHIPLDYDADLCGTPDYFLARHSPLGDAVAVEEPYLLLVEAKRDDFVRAWGQCLAAMVAAQKLNKCPDVEIYGITTNGRTWEFGKLRGSEFTQDSRPFSLLDLDQLCAAVNFMFDQCRQQLQAFVSAA